MAYSQAAARKARTNPSTDFDAIIVGAGVSGLYSSTSCGNSVSRWVFETGGTWYWNRYPGARFLSESWTYGYSFFAGTAERVGLGGAFRGPAAMSKVSRSACYALQRWPSQVSRALRSRRGGYRELSLA